MNLMKYLGKNVEIVDIDGFIWRGYVSEYNPAIDTEDNLETINIMVNEEGNRKFKTSGCYEFKENEIAEIKEVDISDG